MILVCRSFFVQYSSNITFDAVKESIFNSNQNVYDATAVMQ